MSKRFFHALVTLAFAGLLFLSAAAYLPDIITVSSTPGGLEPLYSFLYRRNSFYVHAKLSINTGFFAFLITPKMKHLYRYATLYNTKCNTKMIQYFLPDCQSGRIFLLFYPEFLSCVNLVWICNTVHLCDYLICSAILGSNAR